MRSPSCAFRMRIESARSLSASRRALPRLAGSALRLELVRIAAAPDVLIGSSHACDQNQARLTRHPRILVELGTEPRYSEGAVVYGADSGSLSPICNCDGSWR